MIEQDIRAILVSLAELKGQVGAIEQARDVAREVQDEWKAEIRDELREIRKQTTATNGQVRKHDLLIAQLKGAASVFSWVKAATAAVVAGGVLTGAAYVLSRLFS